MNAEENKKIALRYFEEAPHNPEICDEIFAPAIRFITIQRASITAQAIDSNPRSEKAAYEWLRAVWSPDWHFSVDEVMAENDRVMVRWTFYGQQQGEYYGLRPTFKDVFYSGINIFRLVDGRIAEISDLYDRLWLWQQLGALPDTAEFIARAKELDHEG